MTEEQEPVLEFTMTWSGYRIKATSTKPMVLLSDHGARLFWRMFEALKDAIQEDGKPKKGSPAT